MSSPDEQLEIMVGVDGSSFSLAATEWAAHDAEAWDIPLRLVHVVSPLVLSAWPEELKPEDFAERVNDEANRMIDAAHQVAVESMSSDRTPPIATEVIGGHIVPTMVELSRKAAMFVVGCRGQTAAARAILGSVSSELVHHAHCPVAVIHDEAPHKQRSAEAPVVVGVDGTPESQRAAELAFAEASRRGVGVVAMHAFSDMGPINFGSLNWAPIEYRNIKAAEEQVLAERMAPYRQMYPDVDVRLVVAPDRAAHRLLEVALNAQLVVVGSHRHSGFAAMVLGSVSGEVVNAAEVPVIVVRSGLDQMV